MAGQFDLEVVSSESLTPNMRRIVLGGDALETFPPDQESGYVKLLLEPAEDAERPRLRSYTIRAFDAERRLLVLDFVDHGDNGPASSWASRCRPGDPISVRGPGASKLADPRADWFLFGGDMSALPALSVNLEALPDGARGFAVIEILCDEDAQKLSHPEGIDLRWVVQTDGKTPNSALVDEITSLPWLGGTPYPWFAGEFEAMRSARRFFRDEKHIDRRDMYVSCYWKIGDTDEGMKRAKRLDPEA